MRIKSVVLLLSFLTIYTGCDSTSYEMDPEKVVMSINGSIPDEVEPGFEIDVVLSIENGPAEEMSFSRHNNHNQNFWLSAELIEGGSAIELTGTVPDELRTWDYSINVSHSDKYNATRTFGIEVK